MADDRRPSARTGMALFAALSLIALLGLLLAAAVATTTIAGRASLLGEVDISLGAAADYALATVLGDPATFGLDTLPFGAATTFDIVIPDPRVARAMVNVTRLRGGTFWFVSEVAAAGADPFVRRASVVARSPSPGGLPPSGLITRGGLDSSAGVQLLVDSTGDPDCAAVAASPAPTRSSDSSTYFLTSAQLALIDSGSGSSVVHVRRDTIVGPGTFDGILIGDGSISFVGPIVVTGLVVASGKISAPSGLSLTGALMSFDPDPAAAISLSRATVRYSPCTVAREFRRLLPLRPVRSRAWVELF